MTKFQESQLSILMPLLLEYAGLKFGNGVECEVNVDPYGEWWIAFTAHSITYNDVYEKQHYPQFSTALDAIKTRIEIIRKKARQASEAIQQPLF